MNWYKKLEKLECKENYHVENNEEIHTTVNQYSPDNSCRFFRRTLPYVKSMRLPLMPD